MQNLEFREQLQQLINAHSRENGSNTLDCKLAEYLNDCLTAFDRAASRREASYGRLIWADQTITKIEPQD